MASLPNIGGVGFVPANFENSDIKMMLDLWNKGPAVTYMPHATRDMTSWCAFTGEVPSIINAPLFDLSSDDMEVRTAAKCQKEWHQVEVVGQTPGGQDCLRESLKPNFMPPQLHTLVKDDVLEIGTAYEFQPSFNGRDDLYSADESSFIYVELCDDDESTVGFASNTSDHTDLFSGTYGVVFSEEKEKFYASTDLLYAMATVPENTQIHLGDPPSGGYISVWKSVEHFNAQADIVDDPDRIPFSLCPKRRVRSCPTKAAPPPRAIGVSRYNNITAADIGLLQTRVCCGYDENGLTKQDGCAPNPLSIFERDNIELEQFANGEDCARFAASICVRDAILALRPYDNSYSVAENTDSPPPNYRINLAGVTDAWISPGIEIDIGENPDTWKVLWCFEDRQSVRIEFNRSGADYVPTFVCGRMNQNCVVSEPRSIVEAFDHHTYEVRNYIVDGCVTVKWSVNKNNPNNPLEFAVPIPQSGYDHNPNYVSVVAASSAMVALLNDTSILAGTRLSSTGDSCALLSPKVAIVEPSAGMLSYNELTQLTQSLVAIGEDDDILKFCWVYEADNSNQDTHFEILPIGPKEICLPETRIVLDACDPGVFLGTCLAWTIENQRDATAVINMHDLVSDALHYDDLYHSLLLDPTESLANLKVDNHLFLRFEYDPAECRTDCKCPVSLAEDSPLYTEFVVVPDTTPIDHGCTIFMPAEIYNHDHMNPDFEVNTTYQVRVLRLPRSAFFDDHDSGTATCLLAADRTLLTGGDVAACGPLVGAGLWPTDAPTTTESPITDAPTTTEPPITDAPTTTITAPPTTVTPISDDDEVEEEEESGWTIDSTVIFLQVVFGVLLASICVVACFWMYKTPEMKRKLGYRDKGVYSSLSRA
jgi:hypothetical protein